MHFPDPSPFAPIPGTQPTPHAFFIDRWGTLLETPERGYCKSFQDVVFVEGALEALFRASQAGWLIYLIGNEDAVADGRLGHEAWTEIEGGILAHLGEHGIRVNKSYAALDPRDGSGKHKGDSVYLLPNTGAFYHAYHVDGVELGRSWVIGDSTLELVAGWRAGCRLAAVKTGLALSDGIFDVTPELVAEDLPRAVLELLLLENAVKP
ncbi:MAG: HAD hydrolase-like protein [Planctomycetota bacterium]|nr:HAD hydrolase-like protein [Planctomycetota bacterium]